MTYIDRCLWDYKANLAAIDWLRAELDDMMSMHGQSYELHGGSDVSDPVGNLVSKRQYFEHKIWELQKKTVPITRLYDELSGSEMVEAQMREILKLRFMEHESRSSVIRKLAISGRTYDRRCQAVKQLARRYFFGD